MYNGWSSRSAMQQAIKKAMESTKQQWIAEKLSAIPINRLIAIIASPEGVTLQRELKAQGISNYQELDAQLETLDIPETQRRRIRHELDALKEILDDEYVSLLELTRRFRTR